MLCIVTSSASGVAARDKQATTLISLIWSVFARSYNVTFFFFHFFFFIWDALACDQNFPLYSLFQADNFFPFALKTDESIFCNVAASLFENNNRVRKRSFHQQPCCIRLTDIRDVVLNFKMARLGHCLPMVLKIYHAVEIVEAHTDYSRPFARGWESVTA